MKNISFEIDVKPKYPLNRIVNIKNTKGKIIKRNVVLNYDNNKFGIEYTIEFENGNFEKYCESMLEFYLEYCQHTWHSTIDYKKYFEIKDSYK